MKPGELYAGIPWHDGLLHDASEAYCVDVPRPLKPYLAGYKAIEREVEHTIERWADLYPGALSDVIVKRADEVLLVMEARDLMSPPPAPWSFAQGALAEALAEVIVPWSWEVAERVYLSRFESLVGAR